MNDPMSWDYYTYVPGSEDPLSPWGVVYLVFCAIGFITSVVFYNGLGRQLFSSPVLFRMVRKWGGIGIFAFGIALFFFSVRFVQINPFTFGARIWLAIAGLGIIAMFGYMIWEYRTRYSLLKTEFESQQQRQQYIKATTGAAAKKTSTNPLPATTAPRPVKRKRKA